MDFFQDISRLGDTRISERLGDIFAKLNLPAPDRGQFTRGLGNEGLVFIQQAGCVLRVVNESDYTLRRHPHVMRPIGSIRLTEKYRLDFQYAGQSPVTEQFRDKAKQQLEADGLYIGDARRSNFCYSDDKNTEFPSGVPVMFDPNGIILDNLSKTTKEIRNLSAPNAERPSKILDLSPQNDEEPDGQDIAYADLREKFNAMFDIEQCIRSIVVDPDAVQDFWKAMKQATRQGRLKAPWLDEDNEEAQNKGVDAASLQYDRCLQNHNPVFAPR